MKNLIIVVLVFTLVMLLGSTIATYVYYSDKVDSLKYDNYFLNQEITLLNLSCNVPESL